MNENLKIKDYYIEKCKDEIWFNLYYKNEVTYNGTIYNFLNTNYRKILSFEYYFEEFKKYIDKPRSEWPKKERTGQEKAKQYVRNLVDSFLYYTVLDENKNTIYKLTKKGAVFQKVLEEFENDDKTMLILLLILNGSYNRTINYIVEKTKMVIKELNKNNIIPNRIKEKIITLLNKEKTKTGYKKISPFFFNEEVLWYLTFYNDGLANFLRFSKEDEKKELFELSARDYKLKENKFVLSKKYRDTNNSKSTFLDNCLIFLVGFQIEKNFNFNTPFKDFFLSILKDASSFLKLNIEKIINFIIKNEDIFYVIYKSLMKISEDSTIKYVPPYKEKNINTEKIDTTSEEEENKLEIVREVLKKYSKEKANYKCALEKINMCSYFTSRSENKNYLEVHHFIPREFSHEFDVTIEFLENYVPLCPKCHRMLHLGTDAERKSSINFLFNERKEGLKQNNILIDIEDIYDFYKIN